MRIFFLTVGFLFFVPALVFAQVDEKILLEKAMRWTDTHLQCKDHSSKANHASLGKCEIINSGREKPLFCHLSSSNSTQLILHAMGECGHEVGAISVCNEKFIMFEMRDGRLHADVFFEMDSQIVGETTVRSIKFPTGPDLIWIGEGKGYCGTNKAHLFSWSNGKLKKILTYDYGKGCHQSDLGFITKLFPINNRNIRLLKARFIGFTNEVKYVNISETIFTLDASSGTYQISKAEKDFPFIKGIFDLGIINDEDVLKIISENKNYLDEVIGYLKFDKSDPRREKAHGMLTSIAEKDLGVDYGAWKKWVESQKEDLKEGVPESLPFGQDEYIGTSLFSTEKVKLQTTLSTLDYVGPEKKKRFETMYGKVINPNNSPYFTDLDSMVLAYTDRESHYLVSGSDTSPFLLVMVFPPDGNSVIQGKHNYLVFIKDKSSWKHIKTFSSPNGNYENWNCVLYQGKRFLRFTKNNYVSDEKNSYSEAIYYVDDPSFPNALEYPVSGRSIDEEMPYSVEYDSDPIAALVTEDQKTHYLKYTLKISYSAQDDHEHYSYNGFELFKRDYELRFIWNPRDKRFVMDAEHNQWTGNLDDTAISGLSSEAFLEKYFNEIKKAASSESQDEKLWVKNLVQLSTGKSKKINKMKSELIKILDASKP